MKASLRFYASFFTLSPTETNYFLKFKSSTLCLTLILLPNQISPFFLALASGLFVSFSAVICFYQRVGMDVDSVSFLCWSLSVFSCRRSAGKTVFSRDKLWSLEKEVNFFCLPHCQLSSKKPDKPPAHPCLLFDLFKSADWGRPRMTRHMCFGFYEKHISG